MFNNLTDKQINRLFWAAWFIMWAVALLLVGIRGI